MSVCVFLKQSSSYCQQTQHDKIVSISLHDMEQSNCTKKVFFQTILWQKNVTDDSEVEMFEPGMMYLTGTRL